MLLDLFGDCLLDLYVGKLGSVWLQLRREAKTYTGDIHF